MTRPLNVIAWDTATPWCVVALSRFEADGSVTCLGSYENSESGTHSQVLPGVAADLLKAAGLSPRDLDLAAVGRGPGSFTGLRTGLALAKGLAMGAGIPLIGFCSLEVVAAQILQAHSEPLQSLAAPLIDARHQQIFTALYGPDADGGPLPQEILAPGPIAPAELGSYLARGACGRDIVAAGPAVDLAAESRPRRGDAPPQIKGDATIAAGDGLDSPVTASLAFDSRIQAPSAAMLAAMAVYLFRAAGAEAEKKYPPLPMYIRQPDIRGSGIAMR